jgi:hypothetical protein
MMAIFKSRAIALEALAEFLLKREKSNYRLTDV